MRKSQLIQTVKDNPEQLTRLMQKLPESYPQMSRGPPPPCISRSITCKDLVFSAHYFLPSSHTLSKAAEFIRRPLQDFAAFRHAAKLGFGKFRDPKGLNADGTKCEETKKCPGEHHTLQTLILNLRCRYSLNRSRRGNLTPRTPEGRRRPSGAIFRSSAGCLNRRSVLVKSFASC